MADHSIEHTTPRWRLRAGAASWRAIDGEAVVLDLERSMYLSVNQPGTLLWTALVDGADRPSLIELLVGTYEVDVEQATADVDAFVADAVQRGLLEPL